MKPLVTFQARWSGRLNLMAGVLGVLLGILMVFSKRPIGFVLLLAGMGACVYGLVLLNATYDDDSP